MSVLSLSFLREAIAEVGSIADPTRCRLLRPQTQLDGRSSRLPHGAFLEPRSRGERLFVTFEIERRADIVSSQNQAVDRVYRLGQTMPVQTIRFIIDKSVEDRMLDIQKRKTDLAK